MFYIVYQVLFLDSIIIAPYKDIQFSRYCPFEINIREGTYLSVDCWAACAYELHKALGQLNTWKLTRHVVFTHPNLKFSNGVKQRENYAKEAKANIKQVVK